MRAFTPAERRGALLVALLFALGSVWDLARSRLPVLRAWEEAPAAAGATASAPAPASPPATGGPATPLDLNRAGAADLDRLPGIGPVLAGRIVQHRRAFGRFRTVDELRAVRGVGPRLLERLRPLVVVGGGPEEARGRGPRGVQSARRGPKNAADSAQVRAAGRR